MFSKLFEFISTTQTALINMRPRHAFGNRRNTTTVRVEMGGVEQEVVDWTEIHRQMRGISRVFEGEKKSRRMRPASWQTSTSWHSVVPDK